MRKIFWVRSEEDPQKASNTESNHVGIKLSVSVTEPSKHLCCEEKLCSLLLHSHPSIKPEKQEAVWVFCSSLTCLKLSDTFQSHCVERRKHDSKRSCFCELEKRKNTKYKWKNCGNKSNRTPWGWNKALLVFVVPPTGSEYLYIFIFIYFLVNVGIHAVLVRLFKEHTELYDTVSV